MPKTHLSQDLLKLARLKKDAAAKDKVAKAAKAEADEWQRRCYERMQSEGSEGARVRGKMFTPVATTMGQIQDREAFIAWAKEHDPDLVVEKERSAELNKLVRQCLDDGEPTPPGVGFFVREYISVTGS